MTEPTADPPASAQDLSSAEIFEAECPLCRAMFEGRRWRIVDADHRPDLVVHAADGSLDRSFCPRCIGPGVERPGSFCVVHRSDGRPQVLSFFPPATEDLESESQQLKSMLQRYVEPRGIAVETLVEAGARWIQGDDDVREWLADAWPELRRSSVDPAMLAAPLPALLNSAEPRQQAVVLRACPDLARPNVERFLTHLIDHGQPDRQGHAIQTRTLVQLAVAGGLDEALREIEADREAGRQMAALPQPLRDRVTDFLFGEPPAGGQRLDALVAEARFTAAAVDAAGAPGLQADIGRRLGQRLRECPPADLPMALPQAVRAYELALAALAPARHTLAWSIQMGLAAAWDLRRDGDRARNLELAIAAAAAARESARTLPADRQAEAAMELGVLHVHRQVDDLGANLAIAREALQFAIDRAQATDLREMARYNLALALVEDPAEGDRLDEGIRTLAGYAHPAAIELLFDDFQQQNLLQSLGTALARRVCARPGADPADLDLAAECIDRARSIAKRRGSAQDAAFLASVRARIEADRRQHGRGGLDLHHIIALLDEAGQTLTAERAPFEYARNELRRAGVLQQMGEPGLVREMVAHALQNACRVLTPDSAPDLCRRAQSELGDLRLHAGEPAAAAEAFVTACEASDRVYASTPSVARRAEEVHANTLLHEGLVASLARLDLDDPDIAWRLLEAMERGRARLTLDLMGLRPLPPFAGVPEALRDAEARLIAELAWQIPGAGRAGADDAATLQRQQRSRAALDALWDRIADCGEGGRLHVSLRRVRPPARAALGSLAAQLGPRAAIASLFVLHDRVLLVWLRGDAPPRVHPVPIGAAELRDRWVARFEADVLGPSGAAAPAHQWLALGEPLFGAVAHEVATLDLLVLIPHRHLHGLPLHALSVRGAPLIQHVPVVYGPSVGVLAALVQAERGDRRRGGALVASHAVRPEESAGFEGEADTVASGLHTQALHHVTARAIRIAAPAAGLIHLVCHGFFDAQDPLASGVVLADGVLRARDWLPLKLRCDLITLSACDTGRQQVHEGDELAGLGRTLLQAGASSVLLALWRVYSDAAAEWMTRFYAEAAGGSRAVAFQRATLELRAKDPDPRAWAPFVLIGDAWAGTAAADVQDSECPAAKP